MNCPVGDYQARGAEDEASLVVIAFIFCFTKNKKGEFMDNSSGKRIYYWMPLQYERALDTGEFDIPVVMPGRDIKRDGVSFYSNEKMALNSKLRMAISLSESETISFLARVIKIEMSDEPGMDYVIGVVICEIKPGDKEKIEVFLRQIDIDHVLGNIALDGVVDINFIAGFPPVIKKIGSLVQEHSEALGEYILKCLLFSILDKERYKKFIAEKELNFVYTHSEKARFRVNLHMQRGRVEATFRLIPPNVKSPCELGLPPVVEKLLENKKGLILVAGRTGSGKTTTIASMVDFLNHTRGGIIVTIEDPVEYIHTNNKCIIKQREVGRDTLSFSAAAKNALRQNPDVLVIGEILDTETMDVAITASETGALVLATIHAANASQVLDRATSFFSPDIQKNILSRLSLVLRGVITQMLVPRSDSEGLVLTAEVLIANDAVKKLVRTGDWKSIPTFIQTGKSIGMQTMHDSLEHFYQQGMISAEYLLEEVKS